MIAPLRKVHRVAVISMLIGLPLLLARTVNQRPPSSVVPELPKNLQPLTVDPAGPGTGADPLVYRSATPVAIGSTLPKDAYLVGTLRGTAASQRKSIDPGTTFFAYSLAKQEVLAVFGEQGEVK